MKEMKEWAFSIKNSKTKNQINDSIKELHKYLTEIIDKTVSWTKKSSKNKFF